MDINDKYRKSQVNGTIYISTCKNISPALQQALESGDGELFLTSIPRQMTAEKLVKLAEHFGDIYCLRFKIDFNGYSRGYAYLQYIDAELMTNALNKLPQHFRSHNLGITVEKSMNCRVLILHNVEELSPIQVYCELRKLGRYVKLRVQECRPKCYIYFIIFVNNEAAAAAHHNIREKIGLFGTQARVSWIKTNWEENVDSAACCKLLPRNRNWTFEDLQLSPCGCFKI
ncbi:APOBEC1 complementation factor [Scaptodrosophila lebanonensis]|uniref:APOBEC1 complementation factor n=1 Tax=Drosophila lebanonensis TaxID=7225 RepID=A0A6J2TBD7_DROLE|nr:APOBEC1 complementation factor [Scaptodrosophila lebanonensis]